MAKRHESLTEEATLPVGENPPTDENLPVVTANLSGELPPATAIVVALPTAMFACAPTAEEVAAYWAAGRTAEEAAFMQSKFTQPCASKGCENSFPFIPVEDDSLLVCESCWKARK